MKLLFTRLQQEIGTVKKSVTQFRVETGSDFDSTQFPLIELKPESSKTEPQQSVQSAKVPFEERKTPLALNGKADRFSDIVDLRGVSKKETMIPHTYSIAGILKAAGPNATRIQDSDSIKTGGTRITENAPEYYKPADGEDRSMLSEGQARYLFVTRRFIATQEMVEYHAAQERHGSFEMKI